MVKITPGKNYKDKTQKQLINELAKLHQRVEDFGAEPTKHKKAQRALKVSETRYRRLFETAQDGIILLDADTGKILDINPFLIKMLGYSHKDFLGKRLWEIGLFKDIAASKLEFLALQKKGYVRYENLPVETKSGRPVDVEFVSNVYLVGHKKIIQCNIRDITSHKRAERALQALSLCNRMLVRTKADEKGFLQKICDILVSTGGYRMAWVGFPEKDADKTVIPIVYAGFENGYLKGINITGVDVKSGKGPTGTAIRTMKPCIAEDILHDPGMEPWREEAVKHGFISSIALPLIYDSEIIGVLSIYSDKPKSFDRAEVDLLAQLADDTAFGIKSIRIQEEKINIEKELKRREAYFRSIIENSQDIISVLNNDGTFQYVSHVIEQILGSKAEELIGKSVFEFVHPDEKQKVLDMFKEGIKEAGHIEVVELRFRHTDGSWLYFEAKAKNLLDKDEVTGVTVSVRDITERKKNEDEYKKLQFQLYQAQKMEAIGQLAAGIAHDFSNLLTVITGYGNMLYNKLKDNEPIRDNIEQILNASSKAVNLAQSLLTFGKKHETNLTALDLNKVITDLLPLLKALLGNLVVFKTELTSEQLTIIANTTQVEQILLNLTGNANDAMPKGGFLTITTGKVQIDEQFIREHGYGRTGSFALISVTDTGTGIEKDIIKRIFEPFFTTKPVDKGTGLGLSVVHEMVKQHNGYADVYSEPGKGTTFSIYLPVIEQDAQE